MKNLLSTDRMKTQTNAPFIAGASILGIGGRDPPEIWQREGSRTKW